MNSTVDMRRILIFLAFAFGLAWLIGLIIYLNGGLLTSPLIPNIQVPLYLPLLAAYMWTPAVANLLTRLVTRESWTDTYLRPNIKRGWPFWLAAWFLPAVFTLLGGLVFFVIFPRYFDSQFTTIRQQFEAAGVPVPANLIAYLVMQMILAVLISPLVNSLATFGEEFGWRGYLLQKILPLGTRKAMVLMGIIWGVWHWPVIAMGHNYSLGYPGSPWLGMLAMVWFTFVTGTFLAWVTLRGGSVWPAVIGHAAINGFSAVMLLFTQGEPSRLVGPVPTGMVGSAAWSLFALWLMLRSDWGRVDNAAYTVGNIDAPTV